MSNWIAFSAHFGVAIAMLVQPDAEKKAKADKDFIMKVQEAVEKKIAIEKIEDFVGKRATLNTIRKEDLDAWAFAKIELDVKESQIRAIPRTDRAVFWLRNAKSNDWRLVGVVWTKDKKMKLFFGKLLDP